ncbi:MAG: DUF3179 domain-containing protein [Woeseiaceae bacterium]
MTRSISAATVFLIFAICLLASTDLFAARKNGFVLDDALVPVREIRSGGPPKDGIPALDMPDVTTAAEADYLDDADRVLGINIRGRARAYPIRILNHHEIVNDVVGGEMIAVTWCPLCGSGIAFVSEVNGRALEFGVSGLLYNSDVLMYDRQTESLWSQIMKTAITGEMKGSKLTTVSLVHTTWRDWRSKHPDTEVLSLHTGYRRNYDKNPYAGYERQSQLYFPVNNEDRSYPRKSLVIGLEVDGHFKAYPFEELKAGPERFTDSVGGVKVEVTFDNDNDTASIVSLDGRDLSAMILYWFAWSAFHPDTKIYTADQ